MINQYKYFRDHFLFNLIAWFLNHPLRKKTLLLTIDLIALWFAFYLSFILSELFLSVNVQILDYIHVVFVTTIFVVVNLYFFNGYKPIDERRSERELEIVVKTVSIAFSLTFILIFVAFKRVLFSRYIILFWWIFSILLILFFRLSLREVYKWLWKRGYLRQRVLIVGKGEGAKALKDRLSVQRHSRFEYFESIIKNDNSYELRNENGQIDLSEKNNIENIINKYHIDRIFIIPSGLIYDSVTELVNICRNHKIPVNIVSNEFNAIRQKVSIDEFTGLLTIEANGEEPFNRGLNRLIKRQIDVIGAFFGLIIFAPVYLFLALIIKIEDGGPIIYRRRVLGKEGKEFDAFKMRSMKVNADELLNSNPKLKRSFEKNYKLINDPRITRVGKFMRKFSLDEFPQFVNVLKGQMSLVGPRMIVKSELQKYGKWAEKRLKVKPGITGFWQVNGRQNTNYSERVLMDMFYIDNWSIWMDIIILIKTVWKVFKREGAY